MKNGSAARAAAAGLALTMALLLLPASLLTPPAASAQSRRTPPQAPQKKNTRPEQKPEGQQGEEPVPQDVIQEAEVVKVATNIVNIEATVINKKTKQLVLGLKKENFAVFENEVPKEITNFSTPDAPITVAVVLEYSQLGQLQAYYGSSGTDRTGMEEMLMPTAMFLQRFIKPPHDYVSVIAYDMRPTPITDFTNDPQRINAVIGLLARNRPTSREANLYDALKLALVGGRADSVVLENSESRTSEYAGMTSIQGRRRAIFLVTTGIDTFSKINYDEARRITQNAGIPLYIIGTGELFFKRYGDQMSPLDGLGGATDPGRMTMLQARNALTTFARETGGEYFPITFPGQLSSALSTIDALMRNQYSLAFKPDERRDGKRRKLVVRVDVDGDGKYDDKDFIVKARQFYNAPGDNAGKK